MKKQVLLSLLKSEVIYFSLSLLILGCNGGSQSQSQLQSSPQIEYKSFNSAYHVNDINSSNSTVSQYQSFTVNDATQPFTSIAWNYYSSQNCTGTATSSVIYKGSTPTFYLNAGTWSMNDTDNYNNCVVYGGCGAEFSNTHSIQVTYRYGGGIHVGQCYNNAPSANKDMLANWTSTPTACTSGSPCSFGGSYSADNLPSMNYYVYVANFEGGSISQYSITQNSGQLTDIGTITSEWNTLYGIAINPSGKYVYITSYSGNNIFMYSINQSNGQLVALSPGYINAESSPSKIVVEPSGKYAYVTNFDSNNISMYSINQSNGQLTSIGTINTGNNPYGIDVHPSGKYIYVANYGSNNISIYSINQSNGQLTNIGTIGAATTPVEIAIDPSGKYAYATNSKNDNNISMYSIDQSSGQLTDLNPGTINTGNNPSGIAIDPSGKHVYVTSYLDYINNIFMYNTIESTGQLTNIGTIGEGINQSGIIIDPSGKYVYVTNHHKNSISQYIIESTGQLTTIGTINTGNGPFAITTASIPSQ